MQIRYLIKLKAPILLEDHWPVPFMGGTLLMTMDKNLATGLEVVFTNQPIKYAPEILHDPLSGSTTITGSDDLFPFVRMLLESAFAFVQCYFDVEISIREVEIHFAAENEEEEGQIKVSFLSRGKVNRPAAVSFDMFTRAIMAAETHSGPQFEATLVIAARHALLQDKFIDSFRYSFLLMEALYGDGNFKKAHLQGAFKANSKFVSIVAIALKQKLPMKKLKGSVTEKLLASAPTPEALIDHLVEQRGFYFHGNVKHKQAWKPHDQAQAEALALVAIEIAMLISHDAAAPMFEDNLSKRHYEDAKKAGAIMSFNVEFQFREPSDTFDQTQAVTINTPGTKITAKMAQYVAQKALSSFEHNSPVGALKRATCTLKETGQKVFEMNFFVESQNPEEA